MMARHPYGGAKRTNIAIMVKGVGALREPESARSAMDSLLSSMPL